MCAKITAPCIVGHMTQHHALIREGEGVNGPYDAPYDIFCA